MELTAVLNSLCLNVITKDAPVEGMCIRWIKENEMYALVPPRKCFSSPFWVQFEKSDNGVEEFGTAKLALIWSPLTLDVEYKATLLEGGSV